MPIGAVVLVFLFYAIENTAPALGHLPLQEKLQRIDIPGTLIFMPCIVCLLLALQWGGQQYAWSDGRIIALFVVFGVLLIAFIGIQIWRQEAATVPPRIMKQRTVAAGTLYAFFLGSSFMIVVYYLSIWFQAIKGDSAIRSGFSTLPFILSLVVASIMAGVFVTRVGYYNPPILLGAILTPIAAGLVTLFTPTTAHPEWIGFQVIYGFGVGLGLQQTNIAAQAVLPKKDVPTGMSVVFFGQGLGGTISVAVAQNVLDNQLVSGLKSLPGIVVPKNVATLGATDLRNVFSAEQLPGVIKVYNHAIIVVFYVALGYACVAIIPGLLMEWKTTKGPKPTPATEKDNNESPATEKDSNESPA